MEEVATEPLAESEISLILDTYDDIFSDFDPRPFSQRALSQDFLNEAKRAALDKQGTLEMRFLIPRTQRKLDREVMVKQRLRSHFKRHYELLQAEARGVQRAGLRLIGIGIIMMFITILLHSEVIALDGLLRSFIIIITEPAGWFLFWIGGEKLVYEKRRHQEDILFYHKMIHSSIVFNSY
ncbi:MAG TPA: hypothetical protein VJK03_01365 [Candidatus Nanoarchaeia archaeon]|nr:hypothetical protein [Candidatus Nanoarchaeia archaeon]